MKDVERAQVLEVSPDSVVVIESPLRFHREGLECFFKDLRLAFAPCKVVVLTDGTRLAGVVKSAIVDSGKEDSDGTN